MRTPRVVGALESSSRWTYTYRSHAVVSDRDREVYMRGGRAGVAAAADLAVIDSGPAVCVLAGRWNRRWAMTVLIASLLGVALLGGACTDGKGRAAQEDDDGSSAREVDAKAFLDPGWSGLVRFTGVTTLSSVEGFVAAEEGVYDARSDEFVARRINAASVPTTFVVVGSVAAYREGEGNWFVVGKEDLLKSFEPPPRAADPGSFEISSEYAGSSTAAILFPTGSGPSADEPVYWDREWDPESGLEAQHVEITTAPEDGTTSGVLGLHTSYEVVEESSLETAAGVLGIEMPDVDELTRRLTNRQGEESSSSDPNVETRQPDDPVLASQSSRVSSSGFVLATELSDAEASAYMARVFSLNSKPSADSKWSQIVPMAYATRSVAASEKRLAPAAMSPEQLPGGLGEPRGDETGSGSGGERAGGFAGLGQATECAAAKGADGLADALGGGSAEVDPADCTSGFAQSPLPPCPAGATAPPAVANPPAVLPTGRVGNTKNTVQAIWDIVKCLNGRFAGITRYGGYNPRCQNQGPNTVPPLTQKWTIPNKTTGKVNAVLDRDEAYKATGGTCKGMGNGKVSDHAFGRAVDSFVTPVGPDGLPATRDKPWSPSDPELLAGEALKDWLVANHQALGLDNVIWNRKEYNSGKNNGWKGAPYTGKDPHYNHVHFDL